MNHQHEFAVYDCSLARWATGRSCSNMRELLETVRTMPDLVLEHHMMRCALEDYFELYEFPNDLARWCWDGLGDHVLGEQLGLVDPYHHKDIATLRATLVNVIEDRLWSLEHIPWCRPGRELHLIESRLMAYDTGERITSPAALAEALPRMSPRTLFFHIHEGRRRKGGETDDFSLWLDHFGADPQLVAAIRKLDFYSLNLNQLRGHLIAVFRQYMAASQGTRRETA
ncbi:MAG: DUF5752 family protein [Gemmataceae bacterium]